MSGDDLHIVWASEEIGAVFWGKVMVAEATRLDDILQVSKAHGAIILYEGPPDEEQALKAVRDYIISTESGE